MFIRYESDWERLFSCGLVVNKVFSVTVVLMIPYSHKDAAQALRVLKWIRFMESKRKTSLAATTIVLVASLAASRMEVAASVSEEAKSIAGTIHCTLCDEYDKGWPGACNFMLAESLHLLEMMNLREDAFLLEPDAIPLYPDWWDSINNEWKFRKDGQEFMGNFVNTEIPHMTGIGVYGHNWRSVAPKLVDVQDRLSWDNYAADQILPRAHITPLIQHIWRNPRITDLAILEPAAVVFHQDKTGKLISLLDQKYYDCEADRVTGYSSVPNDINVMTRYFFSSNANRAIKSLGLSFHFEMVDQVGGAWQGVFSTEKESEVVALEALAANPKSGVREISLEEFREALESKKKVRHSPPSTQSAQQVSPDFKINPNPARLVEDPKALRAEDPATSTEGARISSVDEVLKIARVVPPETRKRTVTGKPSKPGKKSK